LPAPAGSREIDNGEGVLPRGVRKPTRMISAVYAPTLIVSAATATVKAESFSPRLASPK